MDLKRAVELPTHSLLMNPTPGDRVPLVAIGRDVYDALVGSAKRELQRQEVERPKRASLERLEAAHRERGCRYCNPGGRSVFGPDEWCCKPGEADMIATADILKALREKVVPWLRAVKMVHFARGPFGPEPAHPRELEELKTDDLLRALGEEVP